MDTIELTGVVHHIEINVSDLARSIQFWGWLLHILGYREYQNWGSGRSWKHGDTYIVLVQTEKKYIHRQYNRTGTGLNHLAFYASSKTMVDTIVEQLQDMGMQLLYQDKHPYAGGQDHYAVYFEDPDRIKIEIIAP